MQAAGGACIKKRAKHVWHLRVWYLVSGVSRSHALTLSEVSLASGVIPLSLSYLSLSHTSHGIRNLNTLRACLNHPHQLSYGCH